jgi:hypothetical protein
MSRGRTINQQGEDSLLKEIAYFYIDESSMFMVCDTMILTIEGFLRQRDYFEKANMSRIEYRMGIVNQLEQIIRHQSLFIWKNDKAFWTTYSGFNRLFPLVEASNGFCNITRKFVPDSINAFVNANHTFTMKAPDDLRLLLVTSTFALFQNKMKLIVKNLRNKNFLSTKQGIDARNEGGLDLSHQLYLVDLTEEDSHIIEAQYMVELQMVFLLTDKGNILSMELRKNEFVLEYFFKNDEFRFIEFRLWETFLMLIDNTGCLTIYQIKKEGTQNPIRKRKAMYVESTHENSHRDSKNNPNMLRTHDDARKNSRIVTSSRGDLHLAYERGSVRTKSFAAPGLGKENSPDDNSMRQQSIFHKNLKISKANSNTKRDSVGPDPYAPSSTVDRKIDARVSKMMPPCLRGNKSSFLNTSAAMRKSTYLFSENFFLENKKKTSFNHPQTKTVRDSQFCSYINSSQITMARLRDSELKDSMVEFNDYDHNQHKKDSNDIEMNLLLATFQANEATKNCNYYKSKRFNNDKKGIKSAEFYFQPCQQFELKSSDQFIQIFVSEYLNEIYLLTKNGWVYKIQRGLLEFQLIKINLARDPFIYGMSGNKFEVFLLTKPRAESAFTVNHPFTALAMFG